MIHIQSGCVFQEVHLRYHTWSRALSTSGVCTRIIAVAPSELLIRLATVDSQFDNNQFYVLVSHVSFWLWMGGDQEGELKDVCK